MLRGAKYILFKLHTYLEFYVFFLFCRYNLTHGETIITSQINLLPATIYTLAIRNNSNKMVKYLLNLINRYLKIFYKLNNVQESKLYATDKGNYLHILWQIPQYTCMILADVIFIATTIEFSFTEVSLLCYTTLNVFPLIHSIEL